MAHYEKQILGDRATADIREGKRWCLFCGQMVAHMSECPSEEFAEAMEHVVFEDGVIVQLKQV